jgi:hypothetical protein
VRILGIETSCDETAASVVEDGVFVRSSVVATQEELHAEYGGVVPEIAGRAHVERILPVIERALTDAGVTLRRPRRRRGRAPARVDRVAARRCLGREVDRLGERHPARGR